MKRNASKSKGKRDRDKVFQAEAEVVAVNERDLPKRLGLLLRNGEGQEKWFSWWSNGRHGEFPALSEGDRVQIAYCQKPPKKKGGEPFLNILELSLAPSEDGEGEGEGEGEEESPNERVREVLAEDLRREASIRAAVAVKAAAAWGWAKDVDELLACANVIYDWLKAKEEAEVADLLREEVIEEG